MCFQDFGVWNITYAVVPCVPGWPGSQNAAALGSVANLGTSVCCPSNPTVCPYHLLVDALYEPLHLGKSQ
jgi:hypothetical protein